jgi:hypothetical protein
VVVDNIYRSRGLRRLRFLGVAVATLIVAATTTGLFLGRSASGHAASSGAPVSSPTPRARPHLAEAVSTATAHKGQVVTVTYRITDPDSATTTVRILIEDTTGGVVANVGPAGTRPATATGSYRFLLKLKPGRYTWFVRTTDPGGVTTVSAAGGGLTVLAPLPPAFPSAAAIARAAAYLKSRNSAAALAVVDARGVVRGYNLDKLYTSASVIKAMLLVQYLRTQTTVSASMRATLTSMIEQSNNNAAYATFAIVGAKGLEQLAKVTGMKHFKVGGDVIFSLVSAGDQARFFFNMDKYLPAQHRAFARNLLSHIVGWESWGAPRVARPAWRVYFKNGWIGVPRDPFRIVNQVARFERGDVTWAMAVLSDGNPHSPYGFVTLEGITARLLGDD